MKSILLFSIISIVTARAQPFVLETNHKPLVDVNISDALQIADEFYILQIKSDNFYLPNDHDSYTELIITDSEGAIKNTIELSDYRTEYHRILKMEGNELYLLGYLQSDTCKSTLVVSKFDIVSETLTHLSSYEFCNRVGLSIIIRSGINNKLFVEEYHSVLSGPSARKYIFSLDSNYTFTPVFMNIHPIEIFSVDFSRKGYLISTAYVYNFYNSDFQFTKQAHNWETNFYALRETHKPFGKNYILEQTVQDNPTADEYGMHIRLVDSNLVVKKKVTILPSTPFNREMDMPFLGGVDIKNENEIWVGGTYGYSPIIDSTFFTIAKLDSNLNVICQHFIGGDTWYFLWGIRALENGGAIVFGNRVEKGGNRLYGNGYAIRVGENCELPQTVSTSGPPEPLLSISAYPNPGINDLTFSVNGFDPATLSVEFIDQLGQLLFSMKDLTGSIQVPDLPAGQYFYRILQKERLLGVGSWVKQ